MNPVRHQRTIRLGFPEGPHLVRLGGWFAVCPDCGEIRSKSRSGGYALNSLRATFTTSCFKTRKQAKDAFHRHKMETHNSGSGEVRSADVA